MVHGCKGWVQPLSFASDFLSLRQQSDKPCRGFTGSFSIGYIEDRDKSDVRADFEESVKILCVKEEFNY